jgi:hypothetical protein
VADGADDGKALGAVCVGLDVANAVGVSDRGTVVGVVVGCCGVLLVPMEIVVGVDVASGEAISAGLGVRVLTTGWAVGATVPAGIGV